jgi:peptide/nickel transport system substrate-binding protein
MSRRRLVQGLALGIAAVPFTGLLAACGGGSGSTPTTSSSSGATSTSAASTQQSGSTSTATAASGSPESTASSGSSSGPAPTKGGTLTIGLEQEPSTLDPHASANAMAHRPLVCLYDTLVVEDDDMNFQPSLAAKWEIATDGKAITFTLQSGVKFHDGTDFNAEAVKFNFDRIMDPATKSTSAVAIIGPYTGTDVVDATNCKVNFSDAFAPFLDSASQAFLSMLSPDAATKAGENFNQHPVGSGPFKFVELVPQDHITLERYDDYNWAPKTYKHNGAAYLDKIVFKTITEANTRLATLKTGETNLIQAVPAQQLPEIQSDKKFKIVQRDVPGAPSYAAINVKKAPTDDLAVRQAINYAVDQSQIVEALFKGTGTPAHNVLAPGTLDYDKSAEIYKPDPDKANQILEQAGWTGGGNGKIRSKNGQNLQITDAVISGLADESVAQLVQGMLLVVGIDLKINSMARAAWYTANNSGDNNMTHVFYVSSDPDVLRNLFWTEMLGKPFNWSQYSNPKVDQLLEDGVHTTDPAKRKDIYSQLQKTLMEDAVILPVYNQVGLSALAANVNDYTYDLRAYPRYYDVSISK